MTYYVKMDKFEKEYITNTKNGLITEQAEKVVQEMLLELFHLHSSPLISVGTLS